MLGLLSCFVFYVDNVGTFSGDVFQDPSQFSADSFPPTNLPDNKIPYQASPCSFDLLEFGRDGTRLTSIPFPLHTEIRRMLVSSNITTVTSISFHVLLFFQPTLSFCLLVIRWEHWIAKRGMFEFNTSFSLVTDPRFEHFKARSLWLQGSFFFVTGAPGFLITQGLHWQSWLHAHSDCINLCTTAAYQERTLLMLRVLDILLLFELHDLCILQHFGFFRYEGKSRNEHQCEHLTFAFPSLFSFWCQRSMFLLTHFS